MNPTDPMTQVRVAAPSETPKKLECYSYTHAFNHQAPWPKCEYEADLEARLQAGGFYLLPGATDLLTSYQNTAAFPNHAYAAVINRTDDRYLFLFPHEAHYIHFMRNYAPLVSIIERIVSR